MGFWIAMAMVLVFSAFDLRRRLQQPRLARERAERWEAFNNKTK